MVIGVNAVKVSLGFIAVQSDVNRVVAGKRRRREHVSTLMHVAVQNRFLARVGV